MNSLRKLLLTSVALIGASSVYAYDFSFASTNGALLKFDGNSNTFAFDDGGDGKDFSISNSSIPGLDGLTGNIRGTFTIGTITDLQGGIEVAPVSGMGQLSIVDGSAVLTADLTWSSGLTFKTAGALNPDEDINLTNFRLTGSSVALEDALSQGNVGSAVTSFAFSGAKNLENLTADNTTSSTTYSGVVSVIPEPAAYAAFLGGLVLFAAGAAQQRRRSV